MSQENQVGYNIGGGTTNKFILFKKPFSFLHMVVLEKAFSNILQHAKS